MWARFRAWPRAIKLCLPHVYPWRHARDKMYQALLTLTTRAWEWGYSFSIATRIQIQTSVHVCCMHTCVMWITFPSPLLNNLDRDSLACKRKHWWNSTSRQACIVLVLYLSQLYNSPIVSWGKTLQIAALFADNNSNIYCWTCTSSACTTRSIPVSQVTLLSH